MSTHILPWVYQKTWYDWKYIDMSWVLRHNEGRCKPSPYFECLNHIWSFHGGIHGGKHLPPPLPPLVPPVPFCELSPASHPFSSNWAMSQYWAVLSYYAHDGHSNVIYRHQKGQKCLWWHSWLRIKSNSS